MEISATTKILGVMGSPISHSMSPTMHNAIIQNLNLDYVYIAFHVEPERLKSACDGFRALEINGINVTIPHKINIMKYLDEIDPIAQGIAAVNTIKNEEGKLIGKNTDGEGALVALKNADFDPKGKKCVIIGSGGASRAISFNLGTVCSEIILLDKYFEVATSLEMSLNNFFNNEDLSSKFQINSSPNIKAIKLDENLLSTELEDTNLLVNATPLGMHPNLDSSPLDSLNVNLNDSLTVFDAVYNPLDTKFLKFARSSGCKTISGIDMLVNQGAIAFKWWTGITPDLKIMKSSALKKILSKVK